MVERLAKKCYSRVVIHKKIGRKCLNRMIPLRTSGSEWRGSCWLDDGLRRLSRVDAGEDEVRRLGNWMPVEGAVDRGSFDAEQFHQLGDRVVAGAVERDEVALLGRGELRLPALELPANSRRRHTLAGPTRTRLPSRAR